MARFSEHWLLQLFAIPLMGTPAPGDCFKALAEASWQFYIDLAEGAFYLGYLDQAAWVLQKAVQEAESLPSEDPRLAATLNRLGVLYHYLGRYLGAEPLFRRAIALMESASGADNPELGTVLYNLGGLYKSQGKFPEAETAYKDALVAWERTLGPDHPDLALAYQNLGEMCMHQGRTPEALFALRRALALLDSRNSEDWITLVVVNKLAAYYTVQERHTEAEPHLWRALELRRRLQGPDHPKVAMALDKLAQLYRKQRKFARAEPLFRLSLFIQEASLGRRHPDFIQTLNDLAELYYAEGMFTEAEPLFKFSLAAFEQALGSEHPHIADRLEHYASILRTLRRNQDAEMFEARARAIRAKRSITL
ncbi:MAG: tetratricopeptide repeat protein [Bryobacteraceae bacterium]